MKKDNKQVWNALILVFQFGINMLVPIFLCSIFGIWLATNIYKMARKLMKK